MEKVKIVKDGKVITVDMFVSKANDEGNWRIKEHAKLYFQLQLLPHLESAFSAGISDFNVKISQSKIEGCFIAHCDFDTYDPSRVGNTLKGIFNFTMTKSIPSRITISNYKFFMPSEDEIDWERFVELKAQMLDALAIYKGEREKSKRQIAKEEAEKVREQLKRMDELSQDEGYDNHKDKMAKLKEKHDTNLKEYYNKYPMAFKYNDPRSFGDDVKT